MRPGAILGRFVAFGCNPEAILLNCVRIALNLQSIHNPQDCSQDCKDPANPVSGIAGHREDCRRSTGPGLQSDPSNRNPGQLSEWAQSWSNASAICLNCSRITQNPESSCNRPDCKYRGLDCGRIATTQRSSFWGLRGTERIAEDPRATAWACPPVWAQT